MYKSVIATSVYLYVCLSLYVFLPPSFPLLSEVCACVCVCVCVFMHVRKRERKERSVVYQQHILYVCAVYIYNWAHRLGDVKRGL